MANGILKVGDIQTSSGSGTINIGQSGETVNFPSGVTVSGAGKVLQVVSANDNTERSTSSTSYVTASNTLSINITPSSTSSKIFITLTGNGYIETDNKFGKFTLYRDSTNIGVAAGLVNLYDISYTGSLAMSILDSPSSTSQLTYQMYFLSTGGNVIINPNGAKSTITAFEIGA
jgi:hypothetical protein